MNDQSAVPENIVAPQPRTGFVRTKKLKNRNRVQIFASLLSAARNGALKTHLMNRGNMSFEMASQYLRLLTEADLIRESVNEETTERIYQTTPQGFKFLEVFETLQGIVGNQLLADGALPASSPSMAERGIESFRVCSFCKPHPWYPDIHPVTRHRGDECLNCHNGTPVLSEPPRTK